MLTARRLPFNRNPWTVKRWSPQFRGMKERETLPGTKENGHLAVPV